MTLIALGLSHHTAPLALRERVVFAPERIGAALQALAETAGVRQSAILSTCNRTEIYLNVDGKAENGARQWLHEWHDMAQDDLLDHLYCHRGDSAVRHILRVAAGLDSMVVGEPQILGQLKQAYRDARGAKTLGPELERLFQHSFAAAKRVRSQTALGENPVSIAYAAVHLARQIFDDLAQQTVLLIGAGDTIELVARHLRRQGVRHLLIANRNMERARVLAERHHGSAIALADMEAFLAESDIIIAGTASTNPVLDAAALRAAQRARKRRPVFIVDLGVPRDVAPEVAELEDVFLYTVDDLQAVIESGMKNRREAAREADEMIELEVAHFNTWLRAQRAVPAIRRYRELARDERDAALREAHAMLDRGVPAADVLEYLASALTQRLMHLPSVTLRQAALDDPEFVADAERSLGIDAEENQDS